MNDQIEPKISNHIQQDLKCRSMKKDLKPNVYWYRRVRIVFTEADALWRFRLREDHGMQDYGERKLASAKYRINKHRAGLSKLIEH